MNQELALRIGLAVLALCKAEFIKQADGGLLLTPAAEPTGGAEPAECTPPKIEQPKSGRRGRPVGSVNTKPYSGRSPGRPRVRPAEETLERNKAYKRAWALENAERIRANRLHAASAAKLAGKSVAATA